MSTIIYYSPHPTHDIVSEVGYSTHQRETIAAFGNLGHTVVPVILGGTEKKKVQQFHSQIKKKNRIKELFKKIVPGFFWNTLKDIQILRHDKIAAKTLELAIEKHKPDLIYERGEYLQVLGLKVAKAKGIPHFLEVNSPCVAEMDEFEGRSILRFIRGHKIERQKLELTDHIFTVSSAMKKFINEFYNINKEIDLIPNCIDPEKDVPTAKEVESIRLQINPEGKFIVGFVGSLFPYHGVDTLIFGFKKYILKYPESKLIVVGDGQIFQELKELAHNELPEDSYLFTGRINHKDVMKYIGCFDIATMARSNWYGSPIKIFEYGLLGRIIMAPDNEPVRDVMTHGKEGFLINQTAQGVTDALLELRANYESYLPMGENFRKKILEFYTWDKQAEFILSHLA